jgi:hypothetical protein
MSDLVGGQISMAFDATPTALPQALSGAIRPLGAGMAERLRALPDLPTLQEQGLKGFEMLWGGGEEITSIVANANRWSLPNAKSERPEPIPYRPETRQHTYRRD